MLVDGHLQRTEQILNIRYCPGNVTPVTRETMSEGGIGCMGLSIEAIFDKSMISLTNSLTLQETYSSVKVLAPSAAPKRHLPLMVMWTSVSAKSALALFLCSSFTMR